jgi:hypothetical protein
MNGMCELSGIDFSTFFRLFRTPFEQALAENLMTTKDKVTGDMCFVNGAVDLNEGGSTGVMFGVAHQTLSILASDASVAAVVQPRLQVLFQITVPMENSGFSSPTAVFDSFSTQLRADTFSKSLTTSFVKEISTAFPTLPLPNVSVSNVEELAEEVTTSIAHSSRPTGAPTGQPSIYTAPEALRHSVSVFAGGFLLLVMLLIISGSASDARAQPAVSLMYDAAGVEARDIIGGAFPFVRLGNDRNMYMAYASKSLLRQHRWGTVLFYMPFTSRNIRLGRLIVMSIIVFATLFLVIQIGDLSYFDSYSWTTDDIPTEWLVLILIGVAAIVQPIAYQFADHCMLHYFASMWGDTAQPLQPLVLPSKVYPQPTSPGRDLSPSGDWKAARHKQPKPSRPRAGKDGGENSNMNVNVHDPPPIQGELSEWSAIVGISSASVGSAQPSGVWDKAGGAVRVADQSGLVRELQRLEQQVEEYRDACEDKASKRARFDANEWRQLHLFDACWGTQQFCYRQGMDLSVALECQATIAQHLLQDLIRLQNSCTAALRSLPAVRGLGARSDWGRSLGWRDVSAKRLGVEASREARRKLIQLFALEVMPQLSSRVLQNQIMRVEQMGPPTRQRTPFTVLAATLMFVSFFLVLLYLILFSANKFTHKQDILVYSFLIWLFIDMFIASSASVYIKHKLIPQLASRDVTQIMAWLYGQLGLSEGKPRIAGETVPGGGGGDRRAADQFNAAPYMFTACRIARDSSSDSSGSSDSFPEMRAVAAFATVWGRDNVGQSCAAETSVLSSNRFSPDGDIKDSDFPAQWFHLSSRGTQTQMFIISWNIFLSWPIWLQDFVIELLIYSVVVGYACLCVWLYRLRPIFLVFGIVGLVIMALARIFYSNNSRGAEVVPVLPELSCEGASSVLSNKSKDITELSRNKNRTYPRSTVGSNGNGSPARLTQGPGVGRSLGVVEEQSSVFSDDVGNMSISSSAAALEAPPLLATSELDDVDETYRQILILKATRDVDNAMSGGAGVNAGGARGGGGDGNDTTDKISSGGGATREDKKEDDHFVMKLVEYDAMQDIYDQIGTLSRKSQK